MSLVGESALSGKQMIGVNRGVQIEFDIFEGILVEEGISLVFGGPEWNEDLQKQTLNKLVTTRGKALRPAADDYQKLISFI